MRNSSRLVLVAALGAALCAGAQAFAQDPAAAKTAPAATAQAQPLAAAPSAGAQAAPAALPVPQSMDLKQCVERGLVANPTIVSARAQLMGSEYSEKSAFADFLPTMSTTYGYLRYDQAPSTNGAQTGNQNTWNMQFNVHQPVFTGFKLLSTYQKASLAKEQNTAQLTQAELTLIGGIQTAYLQHLKAKMDVKSATESVASLADQRKVTQAFYEVGLKPKLDVLQAEVDLATAQQNLLTAKNSLDNTHAQLNSLLNLPLEAPVEYTGALTYLPFGLDLTECLNRAYKNRPDIQIGVKSVEMAEKDAKVTASSFYPQVGADYNYYRKGDTPAVSGSQYYTGSSKESWTVGASATWTFFQWGSTYNAYKSSNETVNKLRSDLDNTKLNAGLQVKQGLLNQAAAADRIHVAQKSVEAAHESYNMAVARYQAQVGTNTDVLDAQARVSSSEAQLSLALSDYQTAISGLYVAMGEKNIGLDLR